MLTSWEEHVKSCDLIFLRAPGFNKKIFFSGKAPPLVKTDKRIRMIPFQTRRPTHNEVQRVHQMLASIECYGRFDLKHRNQTFYKYLYLQQRGSHGFDRMVVGFTSTYAIGTYRH